MSTKLDKHFKCTKALKTLFALGTFTDGERRLMMEACFHAKSVERVVQNQLVPLPKGMREPAPGM